ncbi:MAG: hypothetical protein M3Y89_05730 [Actinomycetota bacterium]|nr:hypothetical protein [Actinomycetota bacterium]
MTAVGVLLAGCASTQASTPRSAGPAPAMSMAPGQSMAGMSMPSASAAAKPTATALMICSDDIKDKVKEVLKLSGQPQASSTFANQIYTCTYHLSIGPLVLAVQHSPSKTAAMSYFNHLKATFGQTESLLGLGEKAYGAPSGVAVVLKDDETLVVDARGVPAVFGHDQQKRTDLANEIASDVLGCWTGD